MKARAIIGLLALGSLVLSCASVQPGEADTTSKKMSRDKEYVIDNPISLADFLRGVPGVNFDWTTGVPILRGGTPLYVLDGVRIGHNYYEVANMVNINNIASVEVIKNATEGLIYGRDVASGVIVIKTKTG